MLPIHAPPLMRCAVDIDTANKIKLKKKYNRSRIIRILITGGMGIFISQFKDSHERRGTVQINNEQLIMLRQGMDDVILNISKGRKITCKNGIKLGHANLYVYVPISKNIAVQNYKCFASKM